MGTDDYHALLFDAGDTDHQLVSFAETWLANPTISEEQTHALEPDERVWSREYAGQPGATLSAALDPRRRARLLRALVVGAAGGRLRFHGRIQPSRR